MKTILMLVSLVGTQLMATSIAHSDKVNSSVESKTVVKEKTMIIEREVRLNRMARMGRELREVHLNKEPLRLARLGRASREVRFIPMVQLKADKKYVRISKSIKKVILVN